MLHNATFIFVEALKGYNVSDGEDLKHSFGNDPCNNCWFGILVSKLTMVCSVSLFFIIRVLYSFDNANRFLKYMQEQRLISFPIHLLHIQHVSSHDICPELSKVFMVLHWHISNERIRSNNRTNRHKHTECCC